MEQASRTNAVACGPVWMRRPSMAAKLMCVVTLVLLLLDASPALRVAEAAGIVVTTLDGEGLTDGLCSLPEAIQNANQNTRSAPDCAAGSGDVPDVITFAVDGVIVIPSNLMLFDPAGVIIDGAGRIITITGTRPEAIVTPLFVQASAELHRLTVANSTGRGVVNQGTLLLNRVTITGNSLGGVGNAANLLVLNSTIAGNSAETGAGLYNGATATAVVANTTISGNTAAVEGGGVQNAGGMTLVNTTMAGNSAPLGGGIGGPAIVKNSVLANSGAAGPDCSGSVIFIGPSLVSTLAGCSPIGDAPLVASPLLGPLTANGGPNPTHALLPGSPARDAGLAATCSAAPVSGLDQRGVTRPQGAGCDLGAFEAAAGVAGGRNLRIGTAGPIDLSWDGGTLQTGYTLLKYNTSTAVATLIAIAAGATSYSDTAAANGVVYCYALAATGPAGLLGLSDLECALTGQQTGSVIAGNFRLALNQTSNATLTWTAPPGGADAYLLVVIPLDGTPNTTVSLGSAAVSRVQALSPAGTCFQLTAFKGTSFGLTDVLCGVPGVSTLANTPHPTLVPASALLQTATAALTRDWFASALTRHGFE